MPRLWWLALLAVASNCGGGPLAPPSAGRGRIVLHMAGPGRREIVNAPALATYCVRDSLLVVVGIGPDAGAGVAVAGLRPKEVGETPVRPLAAARGELAAARLAVRLVEPGDSSAHRGVSGVVRLLEFDSLVSGTVEATVLGPNGRTARLAGSWREIALDTASRAACGVAS